MNKLLWILFVYSILLNVFLTYFAGRVISKLKFQGVFDVVMKGIMLNYISCNIYHFF